MEEKKLSKARIIFQNLLKEERHKKNKSQSDIAKKTGFTQSMVSKYESGERKIDLIETMAVCQAIDVRFQDFIAEFEKRLEEKN